MDNSIVLKRIANKSKRIAKIDENYDITSAQFNQESTALAVSLQNGLLKVYMIQSDALMLIRQTQLDNGGIILGNWIKGSTFVQDNISSQLISTGNLTEIIELENYSEQYSILTAYSENNDIYLLSGGIYPVCIIPSAQLNLQNVKIDLAISPDFNEIVVLSYDQNNSWIQQVDSQQLQTNQNELWNIQQAIPIAQELIKCLNVSQKKIFQEWQMLGAKFKTKFLSGIDHHCQQSGQRTTPAEVLFQCASTGIVSIGMTKFIKEDMHNVKSIQQFKEQFLLQFNSLIVLVTQQFIAIIEKLAYYSQKLEQTPEANVLGIQQATVQNIIKCTELLFYSANLLLQTLSDICEHISNFMQWMQFWTNRILNMDEQNESNKEEPEFDILKLLQFIENDSLLNLKLVTQVLNVPSAKLNLNYTSNFISQYPIATIMKELNKEFKELYSQIGEQLPKHFQVKQQQEIGESNIISTKIHYKDNYYALIRTPTHIKILNNGCYQWSILLNCFDAYFYQIQPLQVITILRDRGNLQMRLIDTQADRTIKQKDFHNDEFSTMTTSLGRHTCCLILNERLISYLDLEDND